MSNLDYVLQDLWPTIINFMNDKTKRQMRSTNKKWLNYIKYNNFVLYHTNKEDLETIVEYLKRYSWPIELTFQKHRFMDLQDITNQLYKLTNLTKMNDSPSWKNFDPIDEREWMRLTTLTNIEHWGFQRHKIPLNVIKHFTKLTKWDFIGSDDEIVPILKQMSKLNSITRHTRTLPFIQLNHPEKLTSLTLSLFPDMAQHSQHWIVLTNLKELSTYSFTKIEIDVIELSNLTALERCTLSGLHNAPSFALLTNLTYLEISTHRWTLESALSLKKLKKLKYLSIHHDVDDQFNILADLDQLRTLHLDRATVDISIESLTSLTNLEALTLTACRAKDFSYLTQLTNLTSLTTYDPVEGLDNSIGRFTSLKYLYLTRPARRGELMGEFIVDFSNLTNLTSLRLSFVKNCPNGLQYLTRLEHLDLGGPFKVCYDFLSHLQGLTALQTLPSYILISTYKEDKSFWPNLTLLTNMQELSINIENDDKLLQLVPMKNLTAITTGYGSHNFTGVHLTALTSLQNIKMQKEPVYSRAELLEKLPYLYFDD